MPRKAAIAALAAISLCLGTAAAASARPATHYYLALGDSLSVGFQPVDASGHVGYPPTTGAYGIETRQGYTNDLAAHYHHQVRGLKLVELGCPGDTTGSLLTGRGNRSNFKRYRCDRKGGSQLEAAVRFLRAHHRPGAVPLVTIDIGANDVDGCATSSAVFACVTAGEAAIQKNLPRIIRVLRRAAPRSTRIANMTLYDPLLAYELSSSSSAQTLSQLSLPLAQAVNGYITKADGSRALTADVFGAFQSTTTTPVNYGGAQIATNVAEVCRLTWMCAPSGSAPNIHANRLGYQTIAGAFEKAIGKLD